jgi:hypothetical protein
VLISQEYAKLNSELHRTDPAFGISGQKWAKEVHMLSRRYSTTDVLDYGCGKQTLRDALNFSIRGYDPCVPGVDSPPEPADIVVCTDVLEHIEPQFIDSVLDDIARLAKVAVFLTVATRPARKMLPDGRNAHLIQQTYIWWLEKIARRLMLTHFENHGGGFLAVCEKFKN